MGIHDRDYSRPGRTPPRYQRAAGWSATTWIIVLCIGIYALDGFLGWTLEPVKSVLYPGVSATELRQLDRGEIALSRPDLARVNRGGMVLGSAFVDGRAVADVEYRADHPLRRWGYFSTARAVWNADPVLGAGGFELWRFITFQFLHANWDHVIFNMLTLYFFGGMVESYLGKKRYVAFYLLCGISGALMYLLLNGLAVVGSGFFGPSFHVPGLLFDDPHTTLVGASAGVFGVIMAAAFLAPNATVLLFFVIPMRLATLAYGLLGFALLAVIFGWTNAGGEAAHIGGALAGFWLVRNPGNLHGLFDSLGRFDPTSRSAKARALARSAAAADADVNRILDKISAQGLHSLNEREKAVLRDASRRPR